MKAIVYCNECNLVMVEINKPTIQDWEREEFAMCSSCENPDHTDIRCVIVNDDPVVNAPVVSQIQQESPTLWQRIKAFFGF